MLPIGLSTCGKVINEELFISLSKNHISHIEISVSSDKYKEINYCSIKQMADKYNITLWSYHLPFSPFIEIDISSKHLKNQTIKYYSELIKKASDIGIMNFVVHPSAEPILPLCRANRMENAKDSLYKLAEIASGYGCNILVENLPRTCLGRNSDEILDLIGAHPSLGVCFDTNHLLDESAESFIVQVSEKIKSLHISDYDKLNERHWLPGEGVTDWKSLYTSLVNSGYKGPWLYEVGFNCPSTIKRSRSLTCEDFYNNANEIFTGKTLTILSTPVSGLNSWK